MGVLLRPAAEAALMSGGMEDETAMLRQRDLAALLELAKSRAAAGEVERPPLRGFTDRGQSLWARIYQDQDQCS